MLMARTAVSSVNYPGAMAIRAGQLALARGVYSAPAATGTGQVRFPDRLAPLPPQLLHVSLVWGCTPSPRQ
jgi:hypothetical protein